MDEIQAVDSVEVSHASSPPRKAEEQKDRPEEDGSAEVQSPPVGLMVKFDDFASLAADWSASKDSATLVAPSAPRKDASRRPAADTDPRLQLVEWSKEARALVFRGTAVPLSELWDALRSDGGLNTFYAAHPTVPGRLVIHTLRIAGNRLCDWPEHPEARAVAYREALKVNDPRFATGAAKYHPSVRGGRLLCNDPSSILLSVIWENFEGGMSAALIERGYELTPSVASKAVAAAAALFEEGLVRSENLLGQ